MFFSFDKVKYSSSVVIFLLNLIRRSQKVVTVQKLKNWVSKPSTASTVGVETVAPESSRCSKILSPRLIASPRNTPSERWFKLQNHSKPLLSKRGTVSPHSHFTKAGMFPVIIQLLENQCWFLQGFFWFSPFQKASAQAHSSVYSIWRQVWSFQMLDLKVARAELHLSADLLPQRVWTLR